MKGGRERDIEREGGGRREEGGRAGRGPTQYKAFTAFSAN